MLGIAADITELSEIEDRLSDTQERLEEIADAAMDAIIAVDDEQRVQVFNTAAEKMFGCLASDAIGAPLDRFLPHRFRAVHREHLPGSGGTDVKSQANAGLRQLWALRSNGDQFPIEASISHSHVGGKRLFTVILRDVAERKRADDALGESEERVRPMADTAPVMLWMSAPDNLCHYFNRSWLEFTGRPMAAELGNGWAEGVHPEDVKRCLDTFERAAARREPFRMEYRIRRYDGEYRWILDTGVPRLSADGAFSGYIGSAVDITEHKVAERVLSGLSHKLMEAQDGERAWIARQLHDDVAQRMALLTIELDQLSRVPPRGARQLRIRIKELRGQAIDLSKDIGIISRRLHSSKLEYLGIASAAGAFCSELSEQKSVAISFSHEGVPDDLPKRVALALFRVLQEALTNAVKHAGVNHFSVALRGGEDEIQLEVVDTGIGFDPQAAVRREGLGLVGMQERLSLVHGEIAIDSRPGAGTQVRARVPLGVLGQLADGALDKLSAPSAKNPA
jgi:PAS domain S-box-containing protein